MNLFDLPEYTVRVIYKNGKTEYHDRQITRAVMSLVHLMVKDRGQLQYFDGEWKNYDPKAGN